MARDLVQYAGKYSESGFWRKLRRHAGSAGKEIVEKALLLYYALQNPTTPGWAKAVITGALGYFIWPVDVLPDVMPGMGFTDDLAIIAVALATVALNIDNDVRKKAAARMTEWFGLELEHEPARG